MGKKSGHKSGSSNGKKRKRGHATGALKFVTGLSVVKTEPPDSESEYVEVDDVGTVVESVASELVKQETDCSNQLEKPKKKKRMKSRWSKGDSSKKRKKKPRMMIKLEGEDTPMDTTNESLEILCSSSDQLDSSAHNQIGLPTSIVPEIVITEPILVSEPPVVTSNEKISPSAGQIDTLNMQTLRNISLVELTNEVGILPGKVTDVVVSPMDINASSNEVMAELFSKKKVKKRKIKGVKSLTTTAALIPLMISESKTKHQARLDFQLAKRFKVKPCSVVLMSLSWQEVQKWTGTETFEDDAVLGEELMKFENVSSVSDSFWDECPSVSTPEPLISDVTPKPLTELPDVWFIHEYIKNKEKVPTTEKELEGYFTSSSDYVESVDSDPTYLPAGVKVNSEEGVEPPKPDVPWKRRKRFGKRKKRPKEPKYIEPINVKKARKTKKKPKVDGDSTQLSLVVSALNGADPNSTEKIQTTQQRLENELNNLVTQKTPLKPEYDPANKAWWFKKPVNVKYVPIAPKGTPGIITPAIITPPEITPKSKKARMKTKRTQIQPILPKLSVEENTTIEASVDIEVDPSHPSTDTNDLQATMTNRTKSILSSLLKPTEQPSSSTASKPNSPGTNTDNSLTMFVDVYQEKLDTNIGNGPLTVEDQLPLVVTKPVEPSPPKVRLETAKKLPTKVETPKSTIENSFLLNRLVVTKQLDFGPGKPPETIDQPKPTPPTEPLVLTPETPAIPLTSPVAKSPPTTTTSPPPQTFSAMVRVDGKILLIPFEALGWKPGANAQVNPPGMVIDPKAITSGPTSLPVNQAKIAVGSLLDSLTPPKTVKQATIPAKLIHAINNSGLRQNSLLNRPTMNGLGTRLIPIYGTPRPHIISHPGPRPNILLNKSRPRMNFTPYHHANNQGISIIARPRKPLAMEGAAAAGLTKPSTHAPRKTVAAPIGKIPTPVGAPTPNATLPTPVMVSVPNVRVQTPARVPTSSVRFQSPVRIPAPNVRLQTPVRIPTSNVGLQTPVRIPTSNVRFPTPVRIPAPNVRLQTPVRIPAPNVRLSTPVRIPAPNATLSPPVRVRIPAPNVTVSANSGFTVNSPALQRAMNQPRPPTWDARMGQGYTIVHNIRGTTTTVNHPRRTAPQPIRVPNPPPRLGPTSVAISRAPGSPPIKGHIGLPNSTRGNLVQVMPTLIGTPQVFDPANPYNIVHSHPRTSRPGFSTLFGQPQVATGSTVQRANRPPIPTAYLQSAPPVGRQMTPGQTSKAMDALQKLARQAKPDQLSVTRSMAPIQIRSPPPPYRQAAPLQMGQLTVNSQPRIALTSQPGAIAVSTAQLNSQPCFITTQQVGGQTFAIATNNPNQLNQLVFNQQATQQQPILQQYLLTNNDRPQSMGQSLLIQNPGGNLQQTYLSHSGQPVPVLLTNSANQPIRIFNHNVRTTAPPPYPMARMTPAPTVTTMAPTTRNVNATPSPTGNRATIKYTARNPALAQNRLRNNLTLQSTNSINISLVGQPTPSAPVDNEKNALDEAIRKLSMCGTRIMITPSTGPQVTNTTRVTQPKLPANVPAIRIKQEPLDY